MAKSPKTTRAHKTEPKAKPGKTPNVAIPADADNEVMKMPTARTIKSLLRDKRALSREIAERNGEFAAEIKRACENQNLHKKAFSITSQMDRLENEKLAELWVHLEHYMEVGGLNARINSVHRFDLGDGPNVEDSEDGDDGDGDAGELNVHPFPSAG